MSSENLSGSIFYKIQVYAISLALPVGRGQRSRGANGSAAGTLGRRWKLQPPPLHIYLITFLSLSCLLSQGQKKHFLNPFLKLSSIEQSAVKYADYRKKLLFLSIVHRLIPIEGHCSSIKVLAQCIAQVGLGHWLMLQLTINTNMFSGLEVSLWIIWSPGPFLPSWGRISSFSICGVRTMKMEKENKKIEHTAPRECVGQEDVL